MNISNQRLLKNASLLAKMPRGFVYLFIFFAYAGMAILQTYPLILNLNTQTPVKLNSIPTIWAYAEHSLLFFTEHPLNLYKAFSPQVMMPMTSSFFLSGTSFGNSIIFGIVYIINKNLYLATNFLLLFLLTGSAFSVFIFARYVLNNSRAAFIAGTIFAFCASNMFYIVDIVCLNFIFIPFILLFFYRFSFEGKARHLAVCGILLAVQFYVYCYHFIIVFYLLIIISIIKRKQVFCRENWSTLLWCSLLSIGLALPLAVPYLHKMVVYRISPSPSDPFISWTSISPSEWINVAPNNLFYGSWMAQHYTSEGWSFLSSLFPGLLVWILIFICVFRAPSLRISHWFFFSILIFTMVTVTGWSPLHFYKQSPSQPLLMIAFSKIFPFFSIIRTPFRLIILFSFAGSILAAGGYVILEKILLKRISFQWTTWAILLIMVVIINLENLSIPMPLYRYDHIFGPSEGDRFLKTNQLPKHPNELILHIPSCVYTNQSSERPVLEDYEEWYAPLFRHLYYRHPTINGLQSYTPEGWVPYPATLMPEKIAQKYLRALGVTVVIVHDSLLYGNNKLKFNCENMQKLGFKHLKSFDDGDHLYLMDPLIHRSQKLYILPTVTDDILQIVAVTPDYYEKSIKKEIEFNINESESFWINPKLCKYQKLEITISDFEGRQHTRKFDYYLPLVIGGRKNIPVKWDLGEEDIKGPYRTISIKCEESYLITLNVIEKNAL